MTVNPIRPCTDADFHSIWEVIDDGASAYRGVIPPDRLPDRLGVPYMSEEHLRAEIDSGVMFWAWDSDGEIAAVMGIQHVAEVTLIRHAYVRSSRQREGIGGRMLDHLRAGVRRPLLIGTWADAAWAIRFYQSRGFRLVTHDEKERLLRKYWNIPERQVETSVVLADERWFAEE